MDGLLPGGASCTELGAPPRVLPGLPEEEQRAAGAPGPRPRLCCESDPRARDLWPAIAQRHRRPSARGAGAFGRRAGASSRRAWPSRRRPRSSCALVARPQGGASRRRRRRGHGRVGARGREGAGPVLETRRAELRAAPRTQLLAAPWASDATACRRRRPEAVDENLAVIDEALKEIRDALDKDRGNPKLTSMLASTHQKKLDVLLRLVKLDVADLM